MKTKTSTVVLAIAGVAAVVATAWAMTVEMPVNAAYLKDHPRDFSIKSAAGKDGLINFTVTRKLDEPKYFVAHLTARHAGRVAAETYFPSYGKKRDNTFHFSLPPEDVAESEFVLGESAYVQVNDDFVVTPGTIDFAIKLGDFVAADLLKPVKEK